MAADDVAAEMGVADVVVFEFYDFLEFLDLEVFLIEKPQEIFLFILLESDLLEEFLLHFFEFLIDILGLLEFAFEFKDPFVRVQSLLFFALLLIVMLTVLKFLFC